MRGLKMTQRFHSLRFSRTIAASLFMLIAVRCAEDRFPLPAKTHSKEWSNPASENFHGVKVVTVGYSSCRSCHGDDLRGGESGVGCYGCHEDYPHPIGWKQKTTADFHGQPIRSRNWSMAECKSCHGADYRGGRSGSSCYTCHTAEAGPEACNVCHGNAEHNYPPEDLSGNTSTSAMGVGAHEKHMALFRCSHCHVVPDSLAAPNHIDEPPAEVHAQWGWDRSKGNCVSSCHGGRLIWNKF
ncbi:MAG: hypothetical protein ONA69_05435 [candidate division KSB1 bacterium]|nr:hypothetical protein [candidate division KSB1 bacterium]MDZ7346222.1 hypothetical protein [candidate division KSB1 bacterium]